MSFHRLGRNSIVFLGTLLLVGTARAEEPVERFLERLRDASLHSLAATYLDSISTAGLVPESMQADIPLEKLLLQQDALPSVRSADERLQKSNRIEKGLQDFLAANASHPRRSEARIQLANLLLNRGQEAMRKPPPREPSASDRETARAAYNEARKLFDNTLAELKPILEKLQGNKAEGKEKEYRERLQGEYRQAEILRGLTARFLGESYAADAPEFKQWLEKAETELDEVVKKTGNREAGRHVLSLLYRGQVEMLLGKGDEAYDSFIQVADIDQGGVFRDWRVQATTALVRLQVTAKEPKFEPNIARAEALLKTAQNQEKWTPDWIDLQLAVAEAQIAWSTALESQPNNQNRAKAVRSDARSLLQALGRRPGSHQDKTKQLLTSIGIEPSAKVDDKIPDVKKFADGLAAAKERLDRIDTNNMSLEILKNRLKSVSGDEKGSIESEIQAIEKGSLGDVRVAEDLLKKAIPLFTKDDSREELARARYLLAFTLLKREAFWECAAIADFVARNGGEFGLPAGRFALFAYSKLIEGKGEAGKRQSISKNLESLASYMLQTWPNAKESEDAALMLIQQASVDNRWSDVERYLGLLPGEGDKPSQIRREVGVIFYARYLLEMDRKRKTKEAPNENDKQTLERAEKILETGWQGLAAATLDQRAVESGNALASIYLKSGRLEKANAVLERSDVGPLVAIQRNDLNLEPRVKMESLRLKLQSLVLAASSSGQKLDSKTIAEIVSDMRKLAVESPEGIARLTGSLVHLSQDLQDQLNQVKNLGDKAKLAEGIQVLLDQLVSVSDDVNLLEWAGGTLSTLGASLESTPATQPQAALLMKSSASSFEKLMNLESRKPGAIKDAGRKLEDIQTKHAQALRGQGNFQAAIDKLEEALAVNPKSVLPQFEAARTYHAWGQSSKNAEYFRKAIEGNKKNIWGWGVLSKNLSRSPQLLEYFFESRFQLADSRFSAGMLEQDAAKKKKTLEFAVGDLRSTAIQFPKVKESAWYGPMDQLMRNLQRELGKPQVGMTEFFTEASKKEGGNTPQ